MKIKELKSQFKSNTIKKLIVNAVLFVFCIAGYYYNSSTEESLLAVQATYSNIESELNSKTFIYNEAESNMKAYLAIPPSKTPSDKQFNLGFERLRVLVPAVKKLKELYFFKSLDYSINDIKKIDPLSSQEIETYENTIAFNFQGLSDEAVFSLIEDLKLILPGFIFIKSFEVVKKFDVNKASATNFLSRAEYAFVSGRIDVSWAITQKFDKSNQPAQPNMPPPF